MEGGQGRGQDGVGGRRPADSYRTEHPPPQRTVAVKHFNQHCRTERTGDRVKGSSDSVNSTKQVVPLSAMFCSALASDMLELRFR